MGNLLKTFQNPRADSKASFDRQESKLHPVNRTVNSTLSTALRDTHLNARINNRNETIHNSTEMWEECVAPRNVSSLRRYGYSLDNNRCVSEARREISLQPCAYCGIREPDCLAYCTRTKKWFCNGTGNRSGGSHIVTHLARARANEVVLHAMGSHEDMPLKCSVCGVTNVFQLGLVRFQYGSISLLCASKCCKSDAEALASSDQEQWKPIVQSRQFITMLVKVPSRQAQLRAQQISTEQIDQLEELWTTNPNATIRDIRPPSPNGNASPVLLKYENAKQYHRTYSKLIELEAAEEKKNKELMKLENITLRLEISNTSCHMVFFCIRDQGEGMEMDLVLGSEVTFSPTDRKGGAFTGKVIQLPDETSDEFGVKLFKSVYITESRTFTIQMNWQPTSVERQKAALDRVLIGSHDIPSFLISRLLGQESEDEILSLKLPLIIPVPSLQKSNQKQLEAICSVLQRRLSLIQGPPGTGKTVTAAKIVFCLRTAYNGKVLAVAPSNTAIDNLCKKISETGLKVVRMCTRSRENMPSKIQPLMLHEQALHLPGHQMLLQLHRLRDKHGFLSEMEEKQYRILRKNAEDEVLRGADVVGCTCASSGDRRLEYLKFESVLVDESTQAIEPECLIPLTNGCSRIALIGDHCQLGPVVKSKQAADAGLAQSMFERFLRLGVPSVMLQVQYRMHPALSQFSSHVFYGSQLVDGVSREMRTRRIDFPWPNPDSPMFFYRHVGREEISPNGVSFLNQSEAVVVDKTIQRFRQAGVHPDSIGVIVPYGGQRTFLLEYLQQSGQATDEKVEVDSVDAFQGREKDYIIFSCVRSNDNQQIGFLKDPRRLNVALTRARYGMIIVGNPSTLCKNRLWNELLHFYHEKNLLVQGDLDNLRRYHLRSPKPRVPYTYQPGDDLDEQVSNYTAPRKRNRRRNRQKRN